MDIGIALLLFFSGIIAGMINVFSGGGSNLTVPLLLFMGLDTATANGTNRLGIAMQSVAAMSRFRHYPKHDWQISWKLGLLSLPGALCGAWVAINISDSVFHYILILVMLISLVLLFIPPKTKTDLQTKQTPWWSYLIIVAIGFYGGFLQIGIGFLLMAALYHLLGLKLVEVNIHKVMIVSIFVFPVLGVFIYSGHVAWIPGLSLGFGSAIGGWLAAHLSLREQGETWIRWVTGVIMGLIIIKLLIDL